MGINEELAKIEKQYHEVNEQMIALRSKEFYMTRQIHEMQRQKLSKLIGVTFRQGDRYCMITDIPQEEFTKAGGSLFNPYQIPAYVIEDNELTFDTVFTRAVNCDRDIIEFFFNENKAGFTTIEPRAQISFYDFQSQMMKVMTMVRKGCQEKIITYEQKWREENAE